MKKISLVFLSALLLIFVGCNSQPTPENGHLSTQNDGVPSWIANPNQNGKRGAVGSAMRTYDQRLSTQRKLAITRALDELSLQQKTDVSLSLVKREKFTNDKGRSKLDVNASYETNNSITAHIEAFYQDKLSGELFVWMVLD